MNGHQPRSVTEATLAERAKRRAVVQHYSVHRWRARIGGRAFRLFPPLSGVDEGFHGGTVLWSRRDANGYPCSLIYAGRKQPLFRCLLQYATRHALSSRSIGLSKKNDEVFRAVTKKYIGPS